MIRFLIRRPIAVTMSFIAFLALGIVAINYIPVSLMPDIDIPEITVQVSAPNTSARELENTVVKPLRRQLMQLSHLADITSEARNENGVIHLKFEYGANIDYAFIEVNEKIDRAMNNFPRNIDRPRVIKANATDIPVFYLNLTLKEVSSSKFQVPDSRFQVPSQQPPTFKRRSPQTFPTAKPQTFQTAQPPTFKRRSPPTFKRHSPPTLQTFQTFKRRSPQTFQTIQTAKPRSSPFRKHLSS
jgi:hypothetical protein